MAGTWIPLAPMAGGKRTQLGVVGFPGSTSQALAASVPQGSLLATAGIYAIGGRDKTSALSRVERFDIVANAWGSIPDIPTARADCAVVAAHKWIYVIGGSGAAGGTGAGTAVERLEPSASTSPWTKRAPLPAQRWSLAAAAVVVNGQLRVYVIGGSNGAPLTKVDWFEVTKTGEGPWKAGPALKVPRERFGIAVANNSIWVVGGRSDIGPEDSIEELKPGAASWTLYKGVLGTPRHGLGAAYSGGLLFAVGGTGPTGPVKTVEAINITTKKTTGTWTALPTLRSQFGVGTIPVFVMSPNDTIPLFVVGGDDANGPKDTAERFEP